MAKWVKEYREKRGWSKKKFADMGPCSETLIGIIEHPDGKGITHPLIANRIAEICGATAKQRDELVHKIHHGTWQPTGKPVKLGANRPNNASAAIPVVKIDRNGNVLARYANMTFAGKVNCVYETKIAQYCRKQQPKNRDEFEVFGGFTFRFAHEWDNMTKAEQIRDIMPTIEVIKRRIEHGDDPFKGIPTVH